MIDPIQLQSIVDGECTGSQRRALLAECEGKPQQWKILALALLEEQQFRKQFAVLGTTMSKEDFAVQSLPGEQGSAETDFWLAGSPVSVNPASPDRYAGALSSTRSPWSVWGPVLAAGFLAVMGFVVGRTFSGMTAQPSTSSVLEVASQIQNTDGEDLNKLSSEKDSWIGLVADSDPYDGMPETDLRVRLPSADYEIPIFDATDFDPTIALAKQEIEIQEANQRLRKQGFEIDMKPEYVTGKLRDGRQVIVPIHQVGLRQYGQ
jgi:hypothetical protein